MITIYLYLNWYISVTLTENNMKWNFWNPSLRVPDLSEDNRLLFTSLSGLKFKIGGGVRPCGFANVHGWIVSLGGLILSVHVGTSPKVHWISFWNSLFIFLESVDKNVDSSLCRRHSIFRNLQFAICYRFC